MQLDSIDRCPGCTHNQIKQRFQRSRNGEIEAKMVTPLQESKQHTNTFYNDIITGSTYEGSPFVSLGLLFIERC